MKDFNQTRDQILDYLGDFAPDYDVDAITHDVREISDDIDDIDPDDFVDLVASHDLSED